MDRNLAASLEVWRPGPARPGPGGMWPDGFPPRPFLYWALFHHLRLFATRDYRILVLRAGGLPVHRTCLLPAHFRFPFMRPGDIQAAALWTRPDHRGRGLGRFALHAASLLWDRPDRRMWYMVREGNAASIRLAEQSGFRFAGRGGKLGLAYRILEPHADLARWRGEEAVGTGE